MQEMSHRETHEPGRRTRAGAVRTADAGTGKPATVPHSGSAPVIVDRVRVDWGEMPVNLVFSYGKVSVFPFQIVRLWSGPHVGMGEVLASPLEFLERLGARLPGADARRLDALLPPEVFAADAVGRDHERILCEAVSIALHDLLGHAAGLPLYALLGGARQLAVPLMPCLFPHGADEARDGARRWREAGCRYLKLKLSGDLAEDRARVEAVRSVWPREYGLQGDANCGYKTREAARRALAELGRAGLNVVEDPLEGAWRTMRR